MYYFYISMFLGSFVVFFIWVRLLSLMIIDNIIYAYVPRIYVHGADCVRALVLHFLPLQLEFYFFKC